VLQTAAKVTKIKASMHQSDPNPHVPVLLEQVLHYLAPKPGDAFLDNTAGYGGHARAILEQTGGAPAVLVDRDQQAIDYLRGMINRPNVQVLHDDFLGASRALEHAGQQFDIILADLGVSSPHLNKASRGFSLSHDGPLDMRMDNRQTLSAADIVNAYNEADLTALFRRYGEEPHAGKAARAIVTNRPFTTTVELADAVAKAIGRRGKVHPATRVFQALRIAVNSELELLEKSLPIWVQLLKPGGRLAIISFHSLEDRIVKWSLADFTGGYDATLQLLNKKPITADAKEIVFNPRARSAKLRAAAKINT
jgi:16S rRNA (cytosine1402-N4)-methyltransferase